MDFDDFLRSRRSVRRFKPEPIPLPILERILTTATYAPSAHNRQPWRFVLVTSGESKSRLADDMAAAFRRDLSLDGLEDAEISSRIERSRVRIRSSPAVILLCMDLTEMDVYPDDRRNQAERLMAIQSTSNAGLQLLLAAHAEGLAAVWTCGPLFAPEAVQATLSLPEAWEPQALLLVGYPQQAGAHPERKLLKDVVRMI